MFCLEIRRRRWTSYISEAFDIEIKYHQSEPDFDNPNDNRRFRSDFQLKYTGPDTGDCLVKIPLHALFIKKKTSKLGNGLELPTSLKQFLDIRYVSSLRDIRRTYQRAFKAVIFAQRFCLSALKSHSEGQSELGFLLAHGSEIAGTSYYFNKSSSTFKIHKADLNYNFLPVNDSY
jgi:hypothetical protein